MMMMLISVLMRKNLLIIHEREINHMIYGGGSINGGYPNSWMVRSGKSHLEMDENWGTPILGNPHIYVRCLFECYVLCLLDLIRQVSGTQGLFSLLLQLLLSYLAVPVQDTCCILLLSFRELSWKYMKIKLEIMWRICWIHCNLALSAVRFLLSVSINRTSRSPALCKPLAEVNSEAQAFKNTSLEKHQKPCRNWFQLEHPTGAGNGSCEIQDT